MWIIEIRLSTVIVHCVETSVIVNQNVLRDFSTQEKKKKKWRNKWTTDYGKRQNMTQHERAFIVLCIYAIVYVWIWRIWKYMLTNLYRVFYVMWNTWSRCSLVSRSPFLSLFCLLSLSFTFLFCWKQNISEGPDWPCCCRLFRFSKPHMLIVETLDPVRNASQID